MKIGENYKEAQMTLKRKRRELKFRKYIFELIKIIIGSFLMAIAVSLFLLPNQLSSGGFTGIATIFYYFLKIPMGVTILLLNIPLFILSFIKKGKSQRQGGFFFTKSPPTTAWGWARALPSICLPMSLKNISHIIEPEI